MHYGRIQVMAAGHLSTGGLAGAASVYRQYARLIDVDRAGLGGRLLLAVDDAHGDPRQVDAAEIVRAANIAGAATLLISEDRDLARERVRSGVCDFLVTNLDEALRILKNELRRRLAVAVCLCAKADATAQRCVARGVQPDLIAGVDGIAALDVEVFKQRGALCFFSIGEAGLSETRFSDSRSARAWSMVSWTSPTQRGDGLATLDALALASMGAALGPARRRWLERAAQYLGRMLGARAGATHTLPMDEQEAATFSAAVRRAVAEGRLPEGVSIAVGVTAPLQSAATE
jgi:hypothetical protein